MIIICTYTGIRFKAIQVFTAEYLMFVRNKQSSSREKPVSRHNPCFSCTVHTEVNVTAVSSTAARDERPRDAAIFYPRTRERTAPSTSDATGSPRATNDVFISIVFTPTKRTRALRVYGAKAFRCVIVYPGRQRVGGERRRRRRIKRYHERVIRCKY